MRVGISPPVIEKRRGLGVPGWVGAGVGSPRDSAVLTEYFLVWLLVCGVLQGTALAIRGSG